VLAVGLLTERPLFNEEKLMPAKLTALTSLASLALLSTAQAAPIQAIAYHETGRVIVGGLTGEIYLSLRGPDEVLVRSNANDIPGATRDSFVPGEVTYLNLGGFNGFVDLGRIVKPGLGGADLSNLRFAYQAGFTSPIVELQPRFIPPVVEPGVEGFWILDIPEPASLSLAAFAMVGLTSLRRRGLVSTPSE
jgi:hypothetical protein